MILRLAWRNLWRRKWRTTLTAMVVVLGILFSSLMSGFKEGMYDRMIMNTVSNYTGYIKVHANGYWSERTLDNSMLYSDSVASIINSTNGVTGVVPRIETFMLAASDSITKGVMVLGTMPQAEEEMSSISDRLVSGNFISEKSNAVVIGEGLANYLQVTVGDTLVLLGQGYHGATAAGKYAIEGLVAQPAPDMNNRIVYLPLAAAQWLMGAENRVTSVSLLVDNVDESLELSSSLSGKLGEQLEVMHWTEFAPELLALIEGDRAEGYILMGVLYMVICFIIFGTVIMLMAERRQEFGMLVAIGMKRIRLAATVFIEMLWIAIIGAVVGSGICYPVLLYFHNNPIRFSDDMAEIYQDYGFEPVMQTSIDPWLLGNQAIIVFIAMCIISLFTVIKIVRLDTTKAMRS